MTRRLVVDANRVYSAILKDGATRRSMMLTGAALFAPRHLRLEIEQHKDEIVAARAGGSRTSTKRSRSCTVASRG